MLSLIPALLLLAFHGPTALERFGHEGRLPEALRALERVWAPEKQSAEGDDTASLERQREAFKKLTALTSDPAFSRIVSEIFGVQWDCDRTQDSAEYCLGEPAVPCVEPLDGELQAVQDGFSACRRTRDGPSA